MKRRDRFQAAREKRKAVNDAEAAGTIADSMDVRMELIRRCRAGELTFNQMQDELKCIKRDAKKNGKITRAQAFSRG